MTPLTDGAPGLRVAPMALTPESTKVLTHHLLDAHGVSGVLDGYTLEGTHKVLHDIEFAHDTVAYALRQQVAQVKTHVVDIIPRRPGDTDYIGHCSVCASIGVSYGPNTLVKVRLAVRDYHRKYLRGAALVINTVVNDEVTTETVEVAK